MGEVDNAVSLRSEWMEAGDLCRGIRDGSLIRFHGGIRDGSLIRFQTE